VAGLQEQIRMTPLKLYAVASILIVGNLIYNCGWGLVKVPESHRRPYLLTILVVSLFPVPIVFPDFITSLISHGSGQLVPGSTTPLNPVYFVFLLVLAVALLMAWSVGTRLMIKQDLVRRNLWG
jgi:hypothetical protein